MKKLAKRLLESIAAASDYVEKRKRSFSSKSRNLHFVLWERAVLSSAIYVEEHIQEALVFKFRKDIHLHTIALLKEKYQSGVGLEFGVFEGRTINLFSKALPSFHFYGFDSCIGLKEDWVGHSLSKGSFSLNGRLPTVNPNVELRQGWFDESLPAFIAENGLDDVHLVHIDGDTFEAAETVLQALGGKLKPGTLILFDEYLGYPNWQNGEHKALIEASKAFGFKYRYLGFTTYQALIEIV